MPTLYLMRHGQTEFNVAGLVQGHCDSPLTELGCAQVRAAGRWLAAQGIMPTRLISSPLGRARATLSLLRSELLDGMVESKGDRHDQRLHVGPSTPQPVSPLEIDDGLIERSYGSLEGGPRDQVPSDLWDPGEGVVAFGGEGSAALKERMVNALTRIMRAPNSERVLAVSHGSAVAQFKAAWADRARCPQDVWIGNCFILVFDFDQEAGAFTNTEIIDPAVA